MPKPTKAQLRKINKLAHTELDEDQVYVFRSLSADTMPVKRFSFFGEYSIIMNDNMLNSLKKDYKTGVGLLASHNSNRLPFGRTFDSEVVVDQVGSEQVKTMYVDHYIVTHTKDEEGNKVPLRTEVNGLTTQDIVNHIDVGHTFDTSIGFSIDKPECSICGNDIRDYRECEHIPGLEYDVQVDGEVEQRRCDIIASDGEGIENSLVYAGAVDRAIITKDNYSRNSEGSENNLQGSVNNQETALYNVDDIKSVPLNSQILCRMSKGNMELFTATAERTNIDYSKGSENMPAENQDTVETGVIAEQVSDMVSLENYNKVVGERNEFSDQIEKLQGEIGKYEDRVEELDEKLTQANDKIAELEPQAKMAETFTEDLVQEVVKAGVQARGNALNKERYERYARTLTVDELKEELSALREEFSGSIEDARATSAELQENANEETVEMSKEEIRQLAAKNAMQRFNTEGGNLEQLTREELAKLSK